MKPAETPECPVCSARESDAAFSKDGFHHFQCRRCRALYLFPAPTDAELAAYYVARAEETRFGDRALVDLLLQGFDLLGRLVAGVGAEGEPALDVTTYGEACLQLVAAKDPAVRAASESTESEGASPRRVTRWPSQSIRRAHFAPESSKKPSSSMSSFFTSCA